MDCLHQALSVLGRKIDEADAHTGIGTDRQRPNWIDPLNDPVQDEGLMTGWCKPKRECSAYLERFLGQHENTHLGDVADRRVQERVTRGTVDRPRHLHALRNAALGAALAALGE